MFWVEVGSPTDSWRATVDPTSVTLSSQWNNAIQDSYCEVAVRGQVGSRVGWILAVGSNALVRTRDLS